MSELIVSHSFKVGKDVVKAYKPADIIIGDQTRKAIVIDVAALDPNVAQIPDEVMHKLKVVANTIKAKVNSRMAIFDESAIKIGRNKHHQAIIKLPLIKSAAENPKLDAIAILETVFPREHGESMEMPVPPALRAELAADDAAAALMLADDPAPAVTPPTVEKPPEETITTTHSSMVEKAGKAKKPIVDTGEVAREILKKMRNPGASGGPSPR